MLVKTRYPGSPLRQTHHSLVPMYIPSRPLEAPSTSPVMFENILAMQLTELDV